jgi:DNA-binding NtrC family response regulator
MEKDEMSQQTSWDELSELVIGHREKPELEEQPSTATILVIDDVASVGDSFESLFRGSGRNYKVIMALSGEEGVKKFKRDKPDLVTIDLIMPGMNGVEVYKALHEIDPRFQGMFVTGYPNSVTNVIEVAKLYGAIGFFEKTAFDVEDEVKLNNFLESVDKGIKNSKRIAWERDYVKAIQAGEIGKPPIWLDTIIGGEKNGKAFEADYRDIRLVTAAK